MRSRWRARAARCPSPGCCAGWASRPGRCARRCWPQWTAARLTPCARSLPSAQRACVQSIRSSMNSCHVCVRHLMPPHPNERVPKMLTRISMDVDEQLEAVGQGVIPPGMHVHTAQRAPPPLGCAPIARMSHPYASFLHAALPWELPGCAPVALKALAEGHTPQGMSAQSPTSCSFATPFWPFERSGMQGCCRLLPPMQAPAHAGLPLHEYSGCAPVAAGTDVEAVAEGAAHAARHGRPHAAVPRAAARRAARLGRKHVRLRR